MSKITVNKMQEIVDAIEKKNAEDSGKFAVLELEETKIAFDTELSFDDRNTFVERVVSVVVNEKGYFPEILNIMLFATSLQMMADVSVPTKSTTVDGETVKVLDFKRLQEWYYAIGERWYGLFVDNYNLHALLCEVRYKIDWELEMKKQATSFNKFFEKAMGAIDHLAEENGVGVVEFAEMMKPQLRNKRNMEEATPGFLTPMA